MIVSAIEIARLDLVEPDFCRPEITVIAETDQVATLSQRLPKFSRDQSSPCCEP